MKIRTLLFIAAMSSFALFSCQSTDISDSENVNQSEIWQKYTAKYVADEQHATVQAQFRFGGKTGTTLRISEPGTILMNDSTMKGSEMMFRGWVYKYEEDAYSPKLTFHYFNADGELSINNLNLKMAEPVLVPESIDITSSASIKWEGPEVGENESIRLIIQDSKGNETTLYPERNGHFFEIKPDAYPSFQNGEGKLYVQRTGIYELEQGTHLGGQMVSDYTSQVYSIQITGGPVVNGPEMATL